MDGRWTDGWMHRQMDIYSSISIRDETVYAAHAARDLESCRLVASESPTLCQVRFCKATQEAREAMSADIVRELREKFGEEKAEEIHPNQDLSDQSDGRSSGGDI